MNDEILDNMNENGKPGGGSTEKLQDKRIAGKLNNLYAQHTQPKVDDSIEKMKERNRIIRAVKHLPPREEEKAGRIVEVTGVNLQQEPPVVGKIEQLSTEPVHVPPRVEATRPTAEAARTEAQEFMSLAKRLALLHSEDAGELGEIAQKMLQFIKACQDAKPA